jgi:glycosyltransferase involved in cell wall biosynthesis
MRRVLHVGPCESRGGMATVMKSMVEHPPNGWVAENLNSHGGGLREKILNWNRARKKIKSKHAKRELDLVHFHVTHSMSWWRKRSLIGFCSRMSIPFVVQIHSGKFDKFCSGFSGSSVRKNLHRKNCRVIVLEERWIDLLSKWIPENSSVVPNSIGKLSDRGEYVRTSKIRLLLLSRNSMVKGHEIAIKALNILHRDGYEATLEITGIGEDSKINATKGVHYLGWVSEQEKSDLISRVDFLISPSQYEGSSMSVIEAMVCGLPCIVSEASRETLGIPEMVVNSESPEDWADRIKKIHRSEEYPIAIKKTLEQSERFSIDRRNNILSKIYEDAVFP